MNSICEERSRSSRSAARRRGAARAFGPSRGTRPGPTTTRCLPSSSRDPRRPRSSAICPFDRDFPLRRFVHCFPLISGVPRHFAVLLRFDVRAFCFGRAPLRTRRVAPPRGSGTRRPMHRARGTAPAAANRDAWARPDAPARSPPCAGCEMPRDPRLVDVDGATMSFTAAPHPAAPRRCGGARGRPGSGRRLYA